MEVELTVPKHPEFCSKLSKGYVALVVVKVPGRFADKST
jgi:hypothetical protein